MKIDDLVFSFVTHENEEGAMVECHIVANERWNAGVQLFSHLDKFTVQETLLKISKVRPSTLLLGYDKARK